MQEQVKNLKKNMILEAARKHFTEYGYDKTRLADIAKDLNIGVGTIYNHFESKERLFSAFLSKSLREIIINFINKAKAEPDPEQRLKKHIIYRFEFMQKNEYFTREYMLLNPMFFNDIRESEDFPMEELIAFLTESIKVLAGTKKLVSDDYVQLAYNFIGLTDGYVKRWIDQGIYLPSKAEEAYDFFMNAIIAK